MQYAVWRLSASLPLPQIYHTNGADGSRWYLLSKYSYTYYGRSFSFASAESSAQACVQVGGCPGADNDATAAWSQLQWDVNTDPATTTVIPPPTDVAWAP
jgi:hypothetical protein